MTDSLPKLDRAQLHAELLAEFDRVVEDVADAVDGARPGHLINDSEESARDALDRFRQIVYEQAMQRKVDAAEAAFPPSDQRGDGEEETEQGASGV
jgi:chemotaxis regulatin CheY-phosphate phosphatase CheZ